MLIWFSLIIPVFTAIILYIFYKHKSLWWEFLIPTGVSFLLILAFKLSIEKIGTADKEYWGGWITNSYYLEDWNEYVHQTCTSTSTDSKGNTTTTTYDCSYVDYHGPQWGIIDSNSINISISQEKYAQIKKTLGNEQFQDMHRDHYTNDGDKYYCTFNINEDQISKVIPVTTIHHYENRVQAANSVYKFREISDQDTKKLFDYPPISDFYNAPAILGGKYPELQSKLNRFNAVYGAKKEIRVWFLIYRGGTEDLGVMQENYWKGGNKNEFVICLGLNQDNTFGWSHIFSWTPKKECVINTRNWLHENLSSKQVGQKELIGFMDWLQPELVKGFTRRNFEEFDYLTIEPPLWSVILTFVVTLLVNIGISFWIVRNEFEDGKARNQSKLRYSRRYKLY
jgi:hypothetical protein